ncbi:hypothetical protein HMSSN036_19010 [Paenibacillus macerans]|nr:hypothetical protein HMSSN036_19010 [Paenibacillus macerans]
MGFDLFAVNIDRVAHHFKGHKGDAHRQDDVQQGKAEPPLIQEHIRRFDKKVVILKEAQHAQIGDHADRQPQLAHPVIVRPADHRGRRVIYQRHGDDQGHKTVIPE